MALPPTSEYRGVAAAISQPASPGDIHTLQNHITALTLYNRQGPSIQYRDPIEDQDIVEAMYRGDDHSYTEIFKKGFRPRDPSSTTLPYYYNLERHVNGGGAPGETSHVDGSVFFSTTRLTNWRPRVKINMILYRYEIFAPGGIDTVLTLCEHNDYPNQQKIAFVGGINRQYIQSFGQTTQAFMNRLRNVRCPTSEEYMINLVFTTNNATNVRKSDIENITSPIEEPYVDPSCNVGHSVDCAFNFNNQVEAFIFTVDQCLINYAPSTTKDFIIKGPMSISDFFPSLRNTIFATGTDATFTSFTKYEVYVFRSNIYMLLNFVTGNTIGRPKKITDGFYSLKNTIFEHDIDPAFASSRCKEAYIFKGDQ
ncbi:hypothetical protein LguiA_002072 [Lonicera macranthoides]